MSASNGIRGYMKAREDLCALCLVLTRIPTLKEM